MKGSAAAWLTRSVERLFMAHAGLAVATATPVQRAVCRVLDGAPIAELAEHPEIAKTFGGCVPQSDNGTSELCVFSGKRCGKTAIAASAIGAWSQRCDVAGLLPGERVRIPVVSLSRDLAAQTFGHIKGAFLESHALRALLASKPTADTLELRHPSGRIVEVVVTAGARAGASVAARWLAGAVFDEFPRMLGAADGAVVNWDHMRGEVVGRILPGGAILNIGQPWAPFGPAYNAFQEHFGRPSEDMVVAKAVAYWMNPRWWTPARCAELKRKDPDRYLTDVEAEFAAQEESLFSDVELARATRELPLVEPANDLYAYTAAMDPATRGNSWTLVVNTLSGRKKRIVLAWQKTGSRAEPLSPRKVFAEIAEQLRPYKVHIIDTDQWSVDAFRDIAAEFGLVLIARNMTAEEQTQGFIKLHRAIALGEVELPPDAYLRADLQRLRKVTTQTGVSVQLVKTSDGRHCDYAPSVLRVMARHLEGPKEDTSKLSTGEREARKIEQAMADERRRMRARRRAA